MLTLLGSAQNSFCDGLRRRDFLRIGGLALGGMNLAQMLRAEPARRGLSHRGIIMIYLPGGPPHQDLYDLKPQAPAEIRGEFSPIASSVGGIEICELLPKLAARMDKLAIVRSLVGSDGAHASTLCATGWSFGNQPPGEWPQIGAVVSALQGRTQRAIPAAADLSMRMQHAPYNLPGPGFLGAAHAPFRPEGEVLEDMTLAAGALDRLRDRSALLGDLDRFRRQADARLASSELDDCTSQALEMLSSSRLVEAMNLEQEDPRVRELYGPDDPQVLPYSQAGYQAIVSKFLLARRLIEAGVRCVTVSFADFDWHGANFQYARKVFPLFDHGISGLVDDLHQRGLQDDVSVVAWGEFGRTPRINASAGRDHWPQVSCCLLAGGGMRTGQAIGSTNRLGEYAQDRPVHYQQVLATLYHNMGIDVAQATVNDLGGRPRYLVDGCSPLEELV